MSGEDSRLRGRWGEALAAEFLRRKGYRIIASGWRCRFGELDLVAEGGEFLCFIEVKLRGSERFGTGAEQVDRRKQPRFDVVEILAPQGMATKRPGIRQIENAF